MRHYNPLELGLMGTDKIQFVEGGLALLVSLP